jgi:hypothetical protein
MEVVAERVLQLVLEIAQSLVLPCHQRQHPAVPIGREAPVGLPSLELLATTVQSQLLAVLRVDY